MVDRASTRATKEPVIAADLVPPTAWSTTQSIQMVFSPNAGRLTTDRSARPTIRWISCDLPLGLPFVDSLIFRWGVARGIMAYSAVTHPWPHPRNHCGTRSSTVAEQITLVSP